MEIGTSDEIRVLLTLLLKLEPETEKTRCARDTMIDELRRLCNAMQDGTPSIRACHIDFHDGTTIAIGDDNRFHLYNQNGGTASISRP